MFTNGVFEEICTGFRFGCSCIDQTFIPQQILGHRHTFRGPAISFPPSIQLIRRRSFVSLNLVEAYVREIHLNHSNVYTNYRSRVHFYRDVSPGWCWSELPLSFFLFSFVIQMVMKTSLSSCKNSGIYVCSDGKLRNLEYVNDIEVLSKDRSKLPVLLDRLNDGVCIFGMHFFTLKA